MVSVCAPVCGDISSVSIGRGAWKTNKCSRVRPTFHSVWISKCMEETTTLKEAVRKAARELLPRIVNVRRHLHAYPELSFQEFNTSAFLCDELEAVGIPYEKMAGTGKIG